MIIVDSRDGNALMWDGELMMAHLSICGCPPSTWQEDCRCPGEVTKCIRVEASTLCLIRTSAVRRSQLHMYVNAESF